jgi:hypothetical protein
MKRYESSTPRGALGLSAVVMAAITIAALVVLPAQLDSVSAEPYAVATAATNVTIESAVTTAPTQAHEVTAHREHVRFACTRFGGATVKIFPPSVQARARCHDRTA